MARIIQIIHYAKFQNFSREYCLLSTSLDVAVHGIKRLEYKPTQTLAHPNIIRLDKVIIDEMLCCDDSMTEYPDALPPSLNPSGLGCHKTMYLFMER